MKNTELITRFRHEVKSVECGPDSKLRVYNLFLLLQDAAYLSAENLGFGYHHLQAKNMTWVLSSLKVQFIDLPQWNDQVKFATWPSGHNRLLGFREFTVEDKNANRLVNASSEWLAIDLNSRRPMSMNDFEKPLPDTGDKVFDVSLNRLNPKRFGEGSVIHEIVVPQSSIDENGHVNNAEYVKWSLDGLHFTGIDFSSILSLQVSFISELFENDRCKICFKKKDENTMLLWGMNSESKDYVFAIEIIL